MTDERDETLDELRAAMNIVPSREFEARVRLATRETHPRGAGWSGHQRAWMWGAVASGAVAAAVIGVVLLRSGAAAAPLAVATRQSRPAAVGTTPAREIQPTTAVAISMPAPRVRGAARGAARVTSVARVARQGPEIVVPPDQAIALARLLKGVSDGRVMIGATKAIDEDVAIAPLSEPAPVTVKEVRIDPLPLPGGAS
jgi:hypothetical protein